MQVKQPKYIRGAYVTLATLCILFAPASTFALTDNQVTVTYPGGNQLENTPPFVAPYNQQYSQQIKITNTSSTPVNSIKLLYPNNQVRIGLLNMCNAGYTGCSNASYLTTFPDSNSEAIVTTSHTAGLGIPIPPGASFYLVANWISWDAQPHKNFQANVAASTDQGASGTYYATQGGGFQPTYVPTSRIGTSSQWNGALTTIAQTVKDNIWFILAVLALMLGLTIIRRWLEKKGMGVRSV